MINNEWKDSISGKTFPTLNPCNEQKIADVAEGDKVYIYETGFIYTWKSWKTWKSLGISKWSGNIKSGQGIFLLSFFKGVKFLFLQSFDLNFH